MSRVTKAAPHLSAEEVKKRMLTASKPLYRQRWMIIYQALVDPQTAGAIALHCGVGKVTVQHLISQYNRFGTSVVETAGKGGRRKAYLPLEQEKQFLEPFFEQAEVGEIATVAQIQRVLEEQVGHEVDDSTVYRLLHRHQWRKLMPRARHPRASEEAQEHFKKT